MADLPFSAFDLVQLAQMINTKGVWSEDKKARLFEIGGQPMWCASAEGLTSMHRIDAPDWSVQFAIDNIEPTGPGLWVVRVDLKNAVLSGDRDKAVRDMVYAKMLMS